MLNSPQAKGKRLEYFVRDLLRGYGFKDVQRNPMSGAISWLKGDLNSKQWPFFTEIKNTEKTKFLEWYKKAESECGSLPPIVVWSKNRQDIYCFLLFSDLLDLMTKQILIHSAIPKPKKSKKVGIEETKNLAFSKYKQLHHDNR